MTDMRAALEQIANSQGDVERRYERDMETVRRARAALASDAALQASASFMMSDFDDGPPQKVSKDNPPPPSADNIVDRLHEVSHGLRQANVTIVRLTNELAESEARASELETQCQFFAATIERLTRELAAARKLYKDATDLHAVAFTRPTFAQGFREAKEACAVLTEQLYAGSAWNSYWRQAGSKIAAAIRALPEPGTDEGVG